MLFHSNRLLVLLFPRIPLVPRRPQSPDPESKPGTTAGKDKKAKDKGGKKGDDAAGTESPMIPSDPDEKLLNDAHAFAVNAVGTIVSNILFLLLTKDL